METELGTIVENSQDGFRYQKIKKGPDSDRSTWMKIPEGVPEDKGRSRATTLGTSFANAAMLNFGDEILGSLVGGISPDMTMQEGRDMFREYFEQGREEYPGTSLAGEIAGSVVPAVGAAATLGPKWAAQLGSRSGGGISAAAVPAAAEGAIYSAGEGQGGIVERGLQALGGGTLAGILGSGVAAGGHMAGRVLEKFRGPQNSNLPTFLAGQQLQEVLDAPGTGPSNAADIAERIAAIGPGTRAVDASPALSRLGRAARNATITAEDQVPFQRVVDRARQRGETLARSLRDAFGIEGRMGNWLDDADAARREVQEQFYRPLTREFEEIDDPAVLNALKTPALRDWATRQGILDEKANVIRKPAFTELQEFLQRQKDTFNSGYSDDIERAQQRIRALEEPFNNMTGGRFAEAQAGYSDVMKQIRAYRTGRELWNRDVSPSVVFNTLRDASPEEAFAIRASILDAVENELLTRETGSAAAGLLENAGPNPLEKLQILVQGDEAFEELLGRFTTSETHQRTWRALSGNSSTSMQQSDVAGLFGGIPTDREGMIRSLLSTFGADLQPREWREAARVLLNSMLEEGDDQAALLAMQMHTPSGIHGAAGAGLGSAAATFAAPGTDRTVGDMTSGEGMSLGRLFEDLYTFDVGSIR